jgi:hypothetical protein
LVAVVVWSSFGHLVVPTTEPETTNGKAISKVMGWGMISKMVRDKNVA